MRILDNMESCYGCSACCNVCPTGAVRMKENAEGFMEPAIDAEKCVACGKCRQVCPAVNFRYPNDPEPDMRKRSFFMTVRQEGYSHCWQNMS